MNVDPGFLRLQCNLLHCICRDDDMLEAGSRTALATVESPVGPVRRTVLVITSFSFLHGGAVEMLVALDVASSTGVDVGSSSSCRRVLWWPWQVLHLKVDLQTEAACPGFKQLVHRLCA